MAEALLEQRVAVKRLDAERPRQLAGDARLARAHEADQDEGPARRLRYRRHPIRSS